MRQTDRTPKPTPDVATHPFDSVMEAWFWFIQAQDARNDGARFSAGVGLIPRPCEPSDILKILNTLYYARRLERDHLLVLRHYGRRQMPPDPRRVKERRAHDVWKEALNRLEPVLIRKGIVRARTVVADVPHKLWFHSLQIYESPSYDR
jgi:hypothetical protein